MPSSLPSKRLPRSKQAYLKASNTGEADFFGNSVAISGDRVVVGAFGEQSGASGVNGDGNNNNGGDFAGAAYTFVRNGTTWSFQDYLKASNTDPGQQNEFGNAVTVAGDYVVVAARLEDSSATGSNGDQINNNAAQSGAAYVFGPPVPAFAEIAVPGPARMFPMAAPARGLFLSSVAFPAKPLTFRIRATDRSRL